MYEAQIANVQNTFTRLSIEYLHLSKMEMYMVMDVLNFVNLSQNTYILVIQNNLSITAEL